MAKVGRKPKLDPIVVAADIASLRGNIAAVAQKNGVTRQAVIKLVGRTPTLQTVVTDAREGMIDHAETSLYRAVLDGQGWAVCFFLKTQGKNRGYVERQEHTGKDGGPLKYADASDEELDAEIAKLRGIVG